MAGGLRWSEEQLKAFQDRHQLPAEAPVKSKPGKFHNTKVVADGITWDSKHEFQRWKELQMLQKGGVIQDLQRQVTFILAPPVKLHGKTKPALRYVADFVYYRAGERVVEDFKSPITAREDLFRAKLHLMKSVHGIEVQIVMKK